MKRVICFGDSNTYGYDPRSYFGDRYPTQERWPDILQSLTGWQISNEGMNGREIPCSAPEIPQDTDLFAVMLGTNDLLQGASAQQAAGKMEAFIKLIPLERKKILLIAPPVFRLGEWIADNCLIEASKRLTAEYRLLARRLGILFLDAQKWDISIGYDGVHFTTEGHSAFAKAVCHELKDIKIV